MFNHINPNDYQSRLHNSIVMYDHVPYSLQLNGDKFKLFTLHGLSEFKGKNIDPRDSKLDISTPNLGWFNYEFDSHTYALYVEKNPVRRWRQGLCSTNTSAYYLADSPCRVRQWSHKDPMYCKGFEDMILGKYPTIDQVLTQLKSPLVHSFAVSRNIAIGKRDNTLIVFYKRDEAGWIDSKTKIVHVPKEQFSHLYSKFLRELNWRVE